jgi:hypothetical protein
MALFKNITISKVLYESMRAYHSVNANGQLSFLYKFALCCLYPLQIPFNQFDLWRRREYLIANCKWQVGQLTNVLNMLYDSTLKRIYIDQNILGYLFAPNIQDANSSIFAANLDSGPDDTVFANNIEDNPFVGTIVKIYIPNSIYSVDLAQIISDIEQIKLSGIQYQLIPF